jgi:hypothetical protein
MPAPAGSARLCGPAAGGAAENGSVSSGRDRRPARTGAMHCESWLQSIWQIWEKELPR